MAVSDTHDVGQWYWHLLRVPWRTPPLQLRGTSHEVEEPWRIGRCVLLSVAGRSLVLGKWGPGRTYDELMAAEAAREPAPLPTVEQIREDFRPEPERVSQWLG